jgi:predicted small metal-binding protein
MAQEDSREFICSHIGIACGFLVRAKTDDQVIEHVHMHHASAHGAKETMPETREKIKGKIGHAKFLLPECA